MRETLKLGLIILMLAWISQMNVGCASFGRKMKAMMGGKPAPDAIEYVESSETSVVSTPRFSEQENLRVNTDRKYRRMTKDRFEDEAEVRADAGSLWVMEGQGAYLFAQNTTRLVGDLLNVKIDGAPRTQLQTKTRVISKLLERLERPSEPAALRAPAAAAGAAAANGAPAGAQQQKTGAEGAATDANAQAAQAPAAQPQAKPETPFAVDKVPTRIVEVLKDGSYRVKGSQEFMIGKREYRVIVTGIVRPEDFNEDGIEAEKLLDSQFDIVSNKRGASL